MIHRYRVKNFKSLRDVTVNFDPVTLLVGCSGSGKSNFLDSIQFLSGLLLKSDWSSGPIRKTFSTICHTNGREEPLRFEIDFSIAGIDATFTYALEFSKNEPNKSGGVFGSSSQLHTRLEESLKLGDKVLFHQKDSKWLVKPPTSEVPKPGLLAIGAFPSISDIVIAFTALTEGIGCHHFSDAVLTNGKYQAESAGLSGDASNYLNVLRDITKNLQDLNVRKSMIATLQRINPSVISAELDSVQKPTKVVVGHQFTSAPEIVSLLLGQESAGFRRCFAYLLALYQRPPKQTLLFEHPEDGIHPGAMSLLAEEILAAPGEGRGQVVLTTHNPMLLDHFASKQIRVVELVDGSTLIGQLSIEQRDSLDEKLLDAGELLTTDPARRSDSPEGQTAQ